MAEKLTREEQYLNALQTLKPELRELLGPEEGTRLNRRLGQYLRRDRLAEGYDAALTRALAAIAEHPPARERLAEILGREGVKDLSRLYQPLPGEGEEIPAGTVMVCPVDPNHYQRRLQFAGQHLRCPEHDVDLVPEESSGG